MPETWRPATELIDEHDGQREDPKYSYTSLTRFGRHRSLEDFVLDRLETKPNKPRKEA